MKEINGHQTYVKEVREHLIYASEVYKKHENTAKLCAPKGYEFTGEFRIPKEGDLFLNSEKVKPIENIIRDYSWSGPRLILKKIPQKDILFKWKDFRFPNLGEWCEHFDPHWENPRVIIKCHTPAAWDGEVNIYERVEIDSK